MKHVVAILAVLLLAASGASAQNAIQLGLGFGAGFPIAGDSPITAEFPGSPEKSFSDSIDGGFSINGFFAVPVKGILGIRAEAEWARLPADLDIVLDQFDGDLSVSRWAAGLQVSPYRTDSRIIPYGFLTLGMVAEELRLDNQNVDIFRHSDIGLNFGGGVNYLVGEHVGVGIDLHFNTGFYSDSSRMWVTPSGQLFFRF